MKLWRFLTPTAIHWTATNGALAFVDRVRGEAPLPLRVRDYVAANATPGDATSVLRAMDDYAGNVRFLMNVGPDKGPLVRELVAKLPPTARILELGAFCGYSSIMLATALGSSGKIVSVEKNEASVEGARANIEFAGLADRVEVIHGSSSDVIPSLDGPFDLVFLDHWKDLYRADLESIERHGLIKSGSIVVADNVGPLFGAEIYLDHVRNSGLYDSENRPATLEYSSIPDAVEISVYR